MTLREMRELLERRGIRLTRSLGQNFLHDANQLRRIVTAAGVQPGDRVLEIGPGLGPLTRLLLEAGARVLAVEKDARLIPLLREELAALSGQSLEVLEGDGLEVARDPSRDWRGWKVVSNLPYSVGSPILVELAQHELGPDAITVTLQWEVVQRLASGPGSGEYGVLTLLVGMRYEVGESFRVPAGCFFPEPGVDSGTVVLRRRSATDVGEEVDAALYRAVVKRAFSQRRKMVGKLLRQEWSATAVEAALEVAGVKGSQRAEELTREQYLSLTLSLSASPHTSSDNPGSVSV